MRERGRGGDGGRDWGNIDWSNIDLSGFGRGGDRITGPSRRVIVLAIVIFVLLLIPVLIGPFVSFLTDLLWFRSLGLESVYLRRFTAGFYAFAVFGAVFFILALPNVYFALRPQMPRVVVDAERRRRGALPMTLRFMWLLLIPAFFFGLAGAAIRVAGRTALALARPARAHLSILGGLFLALIASGYLLDQFELLFRPESVLVGAGYTSINARLPALTILTVIVGVAALA